MAFIIVVRALIIELIFSWFFIFPKFFIHVVEKLEVVMGGEWHAIVNFWCLYVAKYSSVHDGSYIRHLPVESHQNRWKKTTDLYKPVTHGRTWRNYKDSRFLPGWLRDLLKTFTTESGMWMFLILKIGGKTMIFFFFVCRTWVDPNILIYSYTRENPHRTYIFIFFYD